MSDDGPGTREVAHRLFAAEFDDASLSYSESDEERAPNYVVTPTGARVNRLFVAGVLTEVERVNDETSRGRVVDPSAAFVTYAGQYQPDEAAFLERADPPTFVALTGKARTFEPEDSDRVFTSVRPESLNEVDADVRDRWVVSAAEATLDRLAVLARALDSDLRGEELRAALESGGASASLAAGIPKAIDHYGTSTTYVEAIRRLAVDALELIAGDREEVRTPDIAPGEGGDASVGALPDTDVRIATDAPATHVDSESLDESGEEPGVVDDEDAGRADDEGLDGLNDDGLGGDDGLDDDSDAAVPAAETATGDETEVMTGTEAGSTEAGSTEAGSTEAGSTGTEPTLDAIDDGSDDFGDDEVGAFDDSEGSDGSDMLGDTGGNDSGLGDFDDGSAEPDLDDGLDAETEDGEGSTADADAASEMYELDDEEREEIESEFGTDFSTGGEVGDPGEADIDVPDPEELSETPDPGETAETPGTDPGDADGDTGGDADDSDGDADDSDTGSDDDIDLEAAAVETMTDLDDGEGADRAAVVEAVASEHGANESDVDDAIRDALMSGKCYEPADGVLKPI